jgi:endoglucanase Acf2
MPEHGGAARTHNTHPGATLLQVRDYGNVNPQDSFFPMVRHKDFFAGHSW